MRVPKEFDAVDLFYAINGILTREPLHKMGLNRQAYRRAKKAQIWFWAKLIKATDARKLHVKKTRRKIIC